MGKLISTLVGVLAAVGGFTALWVGANLLFDQSVDRFRRFSALLGGAIGALLMIMIDGNQLLTGVVGRPGSLFNGKEPGLFTDGLWAALAGHLFWPLIGAAVGAGLGVALSVLEDRLLRLAVSAGTGTAAGLVISFALRTRYELAMRTAPMIGWTVGLALVGLALAAVRRRELIGRRGAGALLQPELARGLLLGALLGWLLGAIGRAAIGHSVASQLETSVALGVAGLLAGAWIGFRDRPGREGRTLLEEKSRSWIFVGPAVLFIVVMLVIPALQTLLLSFQNDDADNIVEGFVGLENYRTVFGSPNNFDSADASMLLASEASSSIFPWGGSALLPWVALFALVGVGLAFLLGRETGETLSFSGAPLVSLIIAGGLFSFALFSHLRGTLINNLWWVVGVTLLSTGFGLAIAKLSDGARFEATVKSFVFMPMAISFVGASIIWRLMMYQARDVSKNQTGVFNAVWVGLGRATTEWAGAAGMVVGIVLAAVAVAVIFGTVLLQTRVAGTGSSPASWAIGLVGGVAVAALLVASYRSMGGKLFIGGLFVLLALALALAAVRTLPTSTSAAGLYFVLSVVPLWVAYRTFGDGIGGFTSTNDGSIVGMSVNFVQTPPYNNFWLMMILIWIQTGFAMVILSAAIKAVPEDFIEAAKIDGANDGQVFWRITVPQIMPTIGVVATTIMVNVMKVFDIVNVTTNGQFDSQVLANAMYEQSFKFTNIGVGATLAVLIFVGVFPVMVYNIYRLTQEA